MESRQETAKLNKKITLPTGYYFTYGGQFENLKKAQAATPVKKPTRVANRVHLKRDLIIKRF